MALSIDGSASGYSVVSAQTGSVTSGALTSANSGDILVIATYGETRNYSGSTAFPATVAGEISDTTGQSLVYAQRGTSIQSACTGTTYPSWTSLSIFWAYVPSPITASTFTITYGSAVGTTIDMLGILVYCVTGFTGGSYQTAPWDADGPYSAMDGTGNDTTPTVTGVSTVSSTGLQTWFAAGNVGSVGSPSSFGAPVVTLSNGSGFNAVQMNASVLAYASPISSVTVASGQSPANWIAIVDALSTTGGAAADVLYPQIWL
jgi:hypothetical protein